MTREEFIDKYGDYVVHFESYYKYSFVFRAPEHDGISMVATYGGDPDDIYRFEVTKDMIITIRELEPFTGSVMKNGEVIDSFYEF